MRRLIVAIAALVVVASAGTTASLASPSRAGAGPHHMQSPVPLGAIKTRGPDGEVPVWYNKVNITSAELAKIRAGHYRAAFLNHIESTFMESLVTGSKAAFKAMGIKVVAVTNANMDPAQQKRDVSNVLPLHPNIILSLAIDPVSGAQAFRPAVNAGVKLIFLSNKPNGYKFGKDYFGLVTYDIYGLGKATADAMCQGLGGKGKIGYIYYDANFYITNQREAAFLKELKSKCPAVQIVDKEPMANPNDAQTIVSAMLTKHADIQALFVPWDSPPAEGAVAALRAANRRDVKIYTIDLGATNALNMAQGGNIKEETSTLAYEFGYTAAMEGALSVIHKKTPKMTILPAFPVEKSNLASGWKATFDQPLPSNIARTLKSQS